MARKLFGTDGVRGLANQWPMTPEVALKLGQAAALVFRQKHQLKRQRIIVGKDTRLSGYMIEQALASGICSMGADVYLVGPLSTPSIAFLTSSMRADAGVVISGSHNSFEDNGIKFFSRQGFKLPDEVEMQMERLIMEEKLDEKRISGKEVGKAFRIDDAIGRYIVFLKNTFPAELTLDGMRIVLDCANGAAYKVGPEVLEELGAELTTIGVEPNGENINLGCGSLHTEALQKKVLETGADLGIALDGDADRVILCDEMGNSVDGDQILFALGLDLKNQNRLNKNSVVATVLSNMGLEVSFRDQGIQLVRTAVGDRYVVDEMLKNHYNFGGEQSGHIVFLDHNTTGDGMISALQVLAYLRRENKKLSFVTNLFETYPQHQINIKVREKPPLDKNKEISATIDKVKGALKDHGRVLVRYSGTEPLARIMVEGKKSKQVESLANEIAQVVQAQIGV